LCVVVGDVVIVFVGVLVVECVVDDVGDGFEFLVWVLWGVFGFVWCVFDFVYLVYVDEWVEVC